MFLTRRVKERIGAGVGALAFLTLFGGLGALGLWVTAGSIYDGVRARSWVPVEAEIAHVDTGTATFRYYWKETLFASDRVGTFKPGGSTDLDDWEERMDKLLQEAVSEKKPVTAYVNPGNPAEAMLDREIRWKFVLVIMGISFASFVGGLIAFVAVGRNALPRASGGQSYAGVPLLKPRAREVLTQWAVSIVWNGFTLPLAIVVIPDLWASGEYLGILVVGIFPLIGLVILWNAVTNTIAMLREGSPFNARTAT